MSLKENLCPTLLGFSHHPGVNPGWVCITSGAEPGGVHPTSGSDAPLAAGKVTWLTSAAYLLPAWGRTV